MRKALLLLALVGAALATTGAGALPNTHERLVESVPVDSRFTIPQATMPLTAGQAYVLEAVGRYRYNGDMTFPVTTWADAECATGAALTNPNPNLFPGGPGEDVLDVKVGGAFVTWTPLPGTENAVVPACSDASIYRYALTGTGAAVSLRVSDFPFGYNDNLGVVLVNVYEVDPIGEGCVAQKPGTDTCTYVATQPGHIAARGDWIVSVWWSGTCDAGAADLVRSSAGGHNNAGGVAGTWEGSIATGACARATALSSGSVVAIGNPLPPSNTPLGCVALNPGSSVCSYDATQPGSILARGDWRVEVWWGGVCGVGAPNWVRASANGDNNVGGVAGAWDGSIATGSCARATALSAGSFAAIGNPTGA